MGKKGLPDRWEKYSAMGRRIDGTRFICFKVPLDEKFDRHGADFSVRHLADYCSDLGLVVDLTNTAKYYNPESLTSIHIQHHKIMTQGHVLPQKKVVKEFFDTVDKFLDSNGNNDKLIGVHCTHGVNRTGYLVCRYMIQMMGIASDQAIVDFDSARGHNQERNNYTDDLRKAMWINEDPADYVEKKSKHTKFTEGGGDSATAAQLDNSYDDRRKSFGKRRSGSNLHTPDTSDNWRVSSGRRESRGNESSNWSASSGRKDSRGSESSNWRVSSRRRDSRGSESSFTLTPKGTKRDRSFRRYDDNQEEGHEEKEDFRPYKKGPAWSPDSNKSFDRHDSGVTLSEKRKIRRNKMDSRYGDSSTDKYDPYYYQQREAGGPTRNHRRFGDHPAPGGSDEVKTYKGPKWHKHMGGKKAELDESIGENNVPGLEDHEPLVLPLPTEKLFDDAELFSPDRDSKKKVIRECNKSISSKSEKEFVPEVKSAKKKKKGLKRFLPY